MELVTRQDSWDLASPPRPRLPHTGRGEPPRRLRRRCRGQARGAALLRDACAALRKLDVLLAQAAALDDPAAVLAGDARATVDRLVRELERREQR